MDFVVECEVFVCEWCYVVEYVGFVGDLCWCWCGYVYVGELYFVEW